MLCAVGPNDDTALLKKVKSCDVKVRFSANDKKKSETYLLKHLSLYFLRLASGSAPPLPVVFGFAMSISTDSIQ